jgi:excinuclease UvrABC nuclease subunit
VSPVASDPLLPDTIAFDPAGEMGPFLAGVPAKWAVYLMGDDAGRPVQLLCVKNLRASLERRLGQAEVQIGPTRKVNYREIVRHIRWRRVDSAFEADAVYLEAARALFPESYRGMVGFRPAWFVHVNPDTTYPHYTRTIDPTGRTGTYFGPLEDKHAAQKLVHAIENLFDLCRDYSILIQSPRAGPCPWRQMGKCVGPCDGSISLDAYRPLFAHRAAVLGDPQRHEALETGRMQQAAGALEFELAAKIKLFVEQLAQLHKGPQRHLRPLNRFKFLSVQRGPRAGTAKLFLITPGQIVEAAALIAEPRAPGELLRHLPGSARAMQSLPLDDAGVERIGVVARHLFTSKAIHGAFIPLSEVDERSLLKAFGDVQKQKEPPPADGEGVMKELQAL